ncbi:hypothetical protein [Caballeronia sp. NCTM5]|uniref:hypothetical protein n=1 Tax=Caballeronia sp. NCTM5 TaxID=2921755 RepID=UPI002027FEE5|nr:hypothetical protein [Caballeronia sp. NCTM5]
MKTAKLQSLRYEVEKWLSPGSAPVHVSQSGRTHGTGRRYVCVETSQGTVARALFFFRHGDGNWYVYPPAPVQTNVKVWVAA